MQLQIIVLAAAIGYCIGSISFASLAPLRLGPRKESGFAFLLDESGRFINISMSNIINWSTNEMRISISIPDRLLREVDRLAQKAGLSRSRFISKGLEALLRRQARLRLSEAFDAVFSDESVREEQVEEADLFDSLLLDEDRW